MELSKRLQTIAHQVSEGNRLVDIGTDHGYIPIYLLENGKIPFALAMDVGKGPLQRAKEHIQAYGLSDKAVCRLSNGFEQYQKGEADTAVIAGMGGDLMAKILEAGKEKLPGELVLQPQSEWFKVRRFLGTNGYDIISEDMLIEDGKYYVVIKAVNGHGQKMNEIEEQYGPILLKEKHVILKEYLDSSLHTMEQIFENLKKSDTKSAITRKAELEVSIEQVKKGMKYYD
jgi:tRNA (adenine22-N1)-methyltransferase